MAFKAIEIPGGKTTYDAAPRIHFETAEQSISTIVIRYCAFPRSKGSSKVTYGVLKFTSVAYFTWKWYDFQITEPFNKDDHKFGLIEITDSQLIDFLEKHARVPGPRFRAPQPTLPEIRLRHYRVSFDEHGLHDLVCYDEPTISSETVSE